MRTPSRQIQLTFILLAAAAIIVVARVWLAGDLPLTDTTESRYSEMARKMVETGDWLMPQHDYGVPYMAKPPLAIWLSAIGIRLFGAGELGPRLLTLLTSVGFLGYLYRWVRRELNREAAAAAILILMSSALFFLAMGAVMTDLVLVACVDVALLAFWRRANGGGPDNELLLFVAMAFGILTKGPLAAFLVIAPIGAWSVLCGKTKSSWTQIAWIKGSLLTALIALPWYLAAEWQHPGFLRYFLVGENVKRFLVSDWQGDQYGPVHELPHGTIWLFFVIAALPWSIIGPLVLLRSRTVVRDSWQTHRELLIFLLVAAAIPLLLFTAAQNVIFPYALPALAPSVIAVLVLLSDSVRRPRFAVTTAIIATMTTAVIVATTTIWHDKIEAESERELVAVVTTELGLPADSLRYWRHRYYSAEYYSRGHVSVIKTPEQIKQALRTDDSAVFAMTADQYDALPQELQASLHHVGDYSKKSLYAPTNMSATAALSAVWH